MTQTCIVFLLTTAASFLITSLSGWGGGGGFCLYKFKYVEFLHGLWFHCARSGFAAKCHGSLHWLLTIISRCFFSIFAGILIQNFLLQLDETQFYGSGMLNPDPGSEVVPSWIPDPFFANWSFIICVCRRSYVCRDQGCSKCSAKPCGTCANCLNPSRKKKCVLRQVKFSSMK